MRRPSFRKPALSLSMFPFLAVLVCTMGALIVLLVVVVQKAKFEVQVESAQRAQSRNPQAPPNEDLQMQKEVHEWRTQVLEKQRAELQQKAADRRLELSHLEDHIRRLESRWRELTVQAKELAHLGQSNQQSNVANAEQIANLTRDIEQAKQELSEAKAKAAEKPPTFAIVPYEGPNGTKRRPIYIECTDEGIVLQPNGIVLRADDFDESMGPGNPLDAALRTTREYLARHGDTAVNGEPYPLLIVRPNGTIAYAVARAAIKSWDDEFGYELIDAEMKLAYSQPDPALHRELERSIADARSRQAILAMAMPGRFKRGGSGGSGGLVATGNGGFRAAGDVAGSSTSTASYSGRGVTGGSFSSAFRQSSGTGVPNGTSMPPPGSQSGSMPQPKGSSRSSGGNGDPGGPNSSPSNPTMGVNGEAQAHGAKPGMMGKRTSSSGQPGAATPGVTNAKMSGGKGSSGAKGGSGGKPPAGAQPLAAARGENWGLPNRSMTATGFTRYIQVQCLPDRLLVMPEKGDYLGPVVVEMPADTSAAIDPLVSAIWKRMESWGIAAEAGYWKPIVRVQVATGADRRFEELQSLLAGSGLTVERK